MRFTEVILSLGAGTGGGEGGGEGGQCVIYRPIPQGRKRCRPWPYFGITRTFRDIINDLRRSSGNSEINVRLLNQYSTKSFLFWPVTIVFNVIWWQMFELKYQEKCIYIKYVPIPVNCFNKNPSRLTWGNKRVLLFLVLLVVCLLLFRFDWVKSSEVTLFGWLGYFNK